MIIEQPVNTPEAWSTRADQYASAAEACGWSSQSQGARFAKVLSLLNPQGGESLLDFGCGTGALSERVSAQVAYVGYDSAAGMVERAAREHPDRIFQTWLPARRFDLVACVGCFNLTDNWSKERTWHTLRHLWNTTGCRALAVSLYAGQADRGCLVYDEDDLASLLGESFYSRVERWRPNDLVALVERYG